MEQLIAILFMLIFLKEKVEKGKKTIDYPGILAFSLGMLAIIA